MNSALKILLEQRENDKEEMGEIIIQNVKKLIAPYINQLKSKSLSDKESMLLDVVESNLNNIVSPFIKRLSSYCIKLTPMELKIANLIREGYSNQETADILSVSINTIISHRYHIRTKLGLKNTKINLRTHLEMFH